MAKDQRGKERKGGEKMANFIAKIEVKSGQVEAILERLTKAQEEIYKCYSELENMGVVVIKEETASGN